MPSCAKSNTINNNLRETQHGNGGACWKKQHNTFCHCIRLKCPSAKTITKHHQSDWTVGSQHFSCTATRATPLPKLNPCKAQKLDFHNTLPLLLPSTIKFVSGLTSACIKTHDGSCDKWLNQIGKCSPTAFTKAQGQ